MSKESDYINNIVNTLISGKPVVNSTGTVLYIKGFILGSETVKMEDGRDFDFDDLSRLTPYVSKEAKEIERLNKLLEASEALVLELQKPKT